jgi:hypothetical protein
MIMRNISTLSGLRRYRDKLLFVLAYGAIAGAILFAHPFQPAAQSTDSVAIVKAGAN